MTQGRFDLRIRQFAPCLSRPAPWFGLRKNMLNLFSNFAGSAGMLREIFCTVFAYYLRLQYVCEQS